jgi:multiple sugar transport system ATP-binding protein
MGIRPEHVVTGELVESTPFQVDVEVNLIEPTGSDTLVDCEVAGQHFRVRMDGQSRVSVGEKLRLGFAPARVSLFDSKTELRL